MHLTIVITSSLNDLCNIIITHFGQILYSSYALKFRTDIVHYNAVPNHPLSIFTVWFYKKNIQHPNYI